MYGPCAVADYMIFAQEAVYVSSGHPDANLFLHNSLQEGFFWPARFRQM